MMEQSTTSQISLGLLLEQRQLMPVIKVRKWAALVVAEVSAVLSERIEQELDSIKQDHHKQVILH